MNYLLKIFTEPEQVFTELNERHQWQDALLPIVIMAIMGVFSLVLLQDLIREVQIQKTVQFIEKSNLIPDAEKDEMITEQLASIEDNTSAGKFAGYLSSAASTPIRIVFMTWMIMLIGNFFFGGKAEFSQLFVMTTFAYLVTILETFISVPLMLNQWSVDIYLGLGLLGIGKEGSFIFHFMNGLDFFSAWRIILLSIGMSIIYERNQKPFLIAMGIFWIIQTTFLAIIGSMFT